MNPAVRLKGAWLMERPMIQNRLSVAKGSDLAVLFPIYGVTPEHVLPSSYVLSAATMYIKTSIEDADVDALFSVAASDLGNNTPDNAAEPRFDIPAAQTDTLEVGTEYAWVMRFTLSSGATYSPPNARGILKVLVK